MDGLWDKFKGLTEKNSEYILPFLLTFMLNASILGLYGEGLFSVYNFVSVLIILGMFAYFRFLNAHRIIGGIIYVFMGFFCLAMMLRYIFSNGLGSGFQSWFLTAGEEAASEPEYFKALVSVFPFFLSSVVYYFTVALYRTSFLMLGSLVPCALYVKTLTNMSNFYLVCIAGLNAALFAANGGKRDDSKGMVTVGKNARLVSAGVLTCAAMLLSSLVPKQSETKYYEVFEHYFMDAGDANGGISGELNVHSGNAGFFRSLDNTPLYDITADDLVYFRRQTFDIYSLDEHCWYPLEKYSQGNVSSPYNALALREGLNYDNMLAAMKKGAELDEGLKDALSPQLLALESSGEETVKISVVPLSYETGFYISTARSYELERIYSDEVGVTPHLQLIKSFSDGGSAPYGLTARREFGSRNIWQENGGADFTDEEYSEYTRRLEQVLNENGEEELAQTVRAFVADFEFAAEYKADCEDNKSQIPSDIAELSAELTEGLEYDWQKASALQDFFQSGEFAYDLNYIPPRGSDTASYFLFTSKRGTCSDFATAYTLLARAAGLTVRYTEGFSPDITETEGYYRIRASGSHAYPEVYIQNMGWIVFEPTVSAAYSVGSGNIADSDEDDGGIKIDAEILMTVALTLCGIFGIAALVIFAVPAVRRISDDIKIKKGGSVSVMLIYRRISVKFGKKFKIAVRSLTPTELAESIYEKLSLDISGLARIYEKVLFGGIAPTEEECTECAEIYRQFGQETK